MKIGDTVKIKDNIAKKFDKGDITKNYTGKIIMVLPVEGTTVCQVQLPDGFISEVSAEHLEVIANAESCLCTRGEGPFICIRNGVVEAKLVSADCFDDVLRSFGFKIEQYPNGNLKIMTIDEFFEEIIKEKSLLELNLTTLKTLLRRDHD